MGVHSIGLRNIDKPTVWVFPRLLVCLDCGSAEFVVPEAERKGVVALSFGSRDDCARVQSVNDPGGDYAVFSVVSFFSVNSCEGGPTLAHDSLRRPWQVVAQELTAETNPERVVELSKELSQALGQGRIVGKWQGHDGDSNLELTTTNQWSNYEKIVDEAVALMHSDYASMQMLFPKRGLGGELRLLAFRGFNPEAAKFWEWVRADSKSTCGIALCYKSRVIAQDIATCDFMAGSEDQRTYLATGIRACQTTPLIGRGGNVVGMISTHWRMPHHPSEKDFWLFDILATQAADLIESCGREEELPSNERRSC